MNEYILSYPNLCGQALFYVQYSCLSLIKACSILVWLLITGH